MAESTEEMSSSRKRQPNWTKDECLILAELVKKNRQSIEGKFSSGLTAQIRKETWQKITDNLNSSCHQNRSREEVIKKWKNLKSAGKKSYSAFRNETTATGGGPPPTPVSPVTDAVVDCIGRDSTVLTGIGSMSMDSTYVQLLELEPSFENVCEQVCDRLNIPCQTPQLPQEQVKESWTPQPPQPHQDLQSLMREKVKLEIECLKLKRQYLKRKLNIEE